MNKAVVALKEALMIRKKEEMIKVRKSVRKMRVKKAEMTKVRKSVRKMRVRKKIIKVPMVRKKDKTPSEEKDTNNLIADSDKKEENNKDEGSQG